MSQVQRLVGMLKYLNDAVLFIQERLIYMSVDQVAELKAALDAEGLALTDFETAVTALIAKIADSPTPVTPDDLTDEIAEVQKYTAAISAASAAAKAPIQVPVTPAPTPVAPVTPSPAEADHL